jgi:hypothetical protein
MAATLPVLTWLRNAFAVLCGRHGDVAHHTQQAGCSRQVAYHHADKVHQAIADAQLPGASREQLLEDNRRLRHENQQLWDWLDQTIDCPEDQLRHFATQANALGLSLCQTLALLTILLPPHRRPSRATLGRWVQHAAKQARRTLQVLDHACRALVVCLCLDEIFFRRQPVLMAVEPASMAWVVGQRADDRSGETWAKALAAWPDVEEVAADGGSGIERGLDLATAARQAAATTTATTAKPLHARLDVFHIRRDGARALRVEWGRAEALWQKAEQVERAQVRYARSLGDERHFNKSVPAKAWAAATAALEEVCQKERAWGRAVAALQVFTADGRLNDRAQAEAELRAASAELTGTLWAKVRRQLSDRRALTFLDRLHEDLSQAEPCPERRMALAALWQWRREQRRGAGKNSSSAADRVEALLLGVLQKHLGEGWQGSYARVGRVLGSVVRASSAVECVNSIVRMHQARHRNLSQDLLDLKRLSWNCRRFREGKRRRRCPYELLGLKLPSYDLWTLLQMDPEELKQRLSTPRLAA